MNRIMACFFVFGLNALAQDLETLIQRLPAKNTAQGVETITRIADLGPEAISRIISRIGSDDDYKERCALNGLVMLAGRPRDHSYTSLVETGLLFGLEEKKDTDTRAFLIRLLRLIGKDRSAAYLKTLLENPDLSGPAVSALISISRVSKVARDALESALVTKKCRHLAALIHGLSPSQAARHFESLADLAKSPDPSLRCAAQGALSLTKNPEAAKILGAAADQDPHAAHCLLHLAQNLRENRVACLSICRNLILTKGPSITCQALDVMVRNFPEEAMPDLLAASEHEDISVRRKALDLAGQRIGPPNTPGWAAYTVWEAKMKVAAPSLQAEILSMLGRTNACSMGMLGQHLYSKHKKVRLAAIDAIIGATGNRTYPGWLLGRMKVAEDPDEIQAVKQGLETMEGPFLLKKIAFTANEAPWPGKRALLDILENRRAKRHLEMLYYATPDERLQELIKETLTRITPEKDR